MLSLARGPIRTSAIAVASAAIAVSVFAATAIAQDAPEVIRIFSHPVHQRVSTGDQGGDNTAAWQADSWLHGLLPRRYSKARRFGTSVVPSTGTALTVTSASACWTTISAMVPVVDVTRTKSASATPRDARA